ncbi:hypothetical protein BESB_047520 [Besnoitia besnoiti]|uniref:Sulfite exporter TauE/SafE protein n=1 Tax=Besnoitia besnoiti TaxID=94643 RepID=A0A2A9MM17_BESBE|nr:hypothetical protein BESB_047520 [Besnoitia besnoiti]PFH36560.1 hypothetical protein BESB_047520 [Besnoitia besnoiti]
MFLFAASLPLYGCEHSIFLSVLATPPQIAPLQRADRKCVHQSQREPVRPTAFGHGNECEDKGRAELPEEANSSLLRDCTPDAGLPPFPNVVALQANVSVTGCSGEVPAQEVRSGPPLGDIRLISGCPPFVQTCDQHGCNGRQRSASESGSDSEVYAFRFLLSSNRHHRQDNEGDYSSETPTLLKGMDARRRVIPGRTQGSPAAQSFLSICSAEAPVRRLSGLGSGERTLADLANGLAIFCVVIIAGVATVCVTAGTGGGAIFVPLMQLLMRFTTHEATATSQCLMTGSALAGLCINFVRRNPKADMPLIDMDMVLLLGPMQMCGSSAGVVVNHALPAWFIIALLVICLSYEIIKLLTRFRRSPRKPMDVTRVAAEDQAPPKTSCMPATSQVVDAAMPAGCRTPASDREGKAVSGTTTWQAAEPGRRGNDTKEEVTNGPEQCQPKVQLVPEHQELNPDERGEQGASYRQRYRCGECSRAAILYRWKRYDMTKWSVLLIIWIINLVVTFIKGGRRSTFHIVPFCSTAYWVVYAVGCLFLASVALLWGSFLTARHRKRIRLCIRRYSPIVYTSSNVQLLLTQAFLAGVLGAIMGIGGGMILGPILLLKGVPPSVSSALTSCLVLLSASTAATINLTSRMAPPSVSGVLFLVLFCTTLVGKSLLDSYIKKRHLERWLVALLIGVMVCSIGCSIAAGIIDGVNGPPSVQQFMDPCDR